MFFESESVFFVDEIDSQKTLNLALEKTLNKP